MKNALTFFRFFWLELKPFAGLGFLIAMILATLLS
jgi:hypothetical protein